LLVQLAVLLDDPVRFGKFLLGEGLHAYERAATLAITAGPLLDVLVKLPPSAKVEVPNAEIRPMRNAHGGLEGRQELLIDVVENPWHDGRGPRTNLQRSKLVRLYLKSRLRIVRSLGEHD